MAKTEDKRLAALRAKRQTRLSGEPADWSSVDGKLLGNAIAWVAATGGAVRFGYTRDGGAYAVGIYSGADRITEYIRPNEDIEAYLSGLAEDFEALYREQQRQ